MFNIQHISVKIKACKIIISITRSKIKLIGWIIIYSIYHTIKKICIIVNSKKTHKNVRVNEKM